MARQYLAVVTVMSTRSHAMLNEPVERRSPIESGLTAVLNGVGNIMFDLSDGMTLELAESLHCLKVTIYNSDDEKWAKMVKVPAFDVQDLMI